MREPGGAMKWTSLALTNTGVQSTPLVISEKRVVNSKPNGPPAGVVSIAPVTPLRKMKSNSLAKVPAPLLTLPGLKVSTPLPRPGSPHDGLKSFVVDQGWPSGSVPVDDPPNGTMTACAGAEARPATMPPTTRAVLRSDLIIADLECAGGRRTIA